MGFPLSGFLSSQPIVINGKSDEAQQFLGAHGVKVAAADNGKELSTAAIAEQAVKMTVRLECWR